MRDSGGVEDDDLKGSPKKKATSTKSKKSRMQRSSIVTTKTNTKSTNETAEALSSAAEEEGSGRGRVSNSLTEKQTLQITNNAVFDDEVYAVNMP
ncbi:uncharacterized protein A4U43_C04F3100 [Asparagus officinalis]|uniref:Uncharacterized protein n=1 Tax=Asparagus officinalis TaxID=4686 RepID=A0A5P1EYD0_ASPOF|nr:uncharacterized protein A4U43_C04F3100 [Asparagus officinalis]